MSVHAAPKLSHEEGTIAPQRPTQTSASRTIAALFLREMSTTYGRNPGGWLWAFVEPIAAISLLAFAFSLAFVAPPLGSGFALFYATGFLPYMLFHDVSQKTAVSIRFSRNLLNFSAVTYLDTIFARFVLNVLTHVLVITLVIGVLVSLSPSDAYVDFGVAGLSLAAAAALALGVGTLNCYLFTAFPAWERLWTIALRPLFIISGVLFLFEDVPEKLQKFLQLNPLFHITGLMRDAIYPTYAPTYTLPSFTFGFAAATGLFGLLLLHRFHDDLMHS